MEEETCGSENSGCCQDESSEKCGCSEEGKCCEKGYDKMDMMMWLVHSAKTELIKEKMKKKLEANLGKKLDMAADLFVEAMMQEWKGKVENAKRKEELREKFEAIFRNE